MLPPDFAFSQQNLQDFQDCPRRFYLRYVEHLEWPAIESEPVLEQERLMDLGQTFHTLVQQYLSGVPAEDIQPNTQDEVLDRWWGNFLALELDLTSKHYYVEEMLSVPLASFRLVAKFDLIIMDDQGNIVIYDWKTSRKAPNRSRLTLRIQSIVYPFVAVRASAGLTRSSSVEPERVKMIYWYPEHPHLPVELDYSTASYERDEAIITNMVTTIGSMGGREDFAKTDDLRRCKFCAFRSFCGRGDTPGSSDEDLLSPSSTGDEAFEINFDSI